MFDAISELTDKLSDNVILTTSSVSAGSVAEAVQVNHEIAIFVLVTAGIVTRVALERAWARHERRARLEHDRQRRDYLRAHRAAVHKSRQEV